MDDEIGKSKRPVGNNPELFIGFSKNKKLEAT
jgi:hypothetical protein